MKNLFILFVLCCSAFCSFAQEHLSFKGIPIDGSMTSFCKKLTDKGFVQMGHENNFSSFIGDFTGRPAHVGVFSTDDGKNVHSVVVAFDPSDEWKTLLTTYEYFKDLYTRKYGEPYASREHNPSSDKDNITIMTELSLGRITYETSWDAPGGIIGLSISKDEYYNGLVIIKYRDAQNVVAKMQKDLDDI